MDDDAPEKRPRPRSPTISYSTDATSVGNHMDDGSLDGLDGADRRICSAAVLAVDITEIHSPEWVASVSKKFGLNPRSSMDRVTGWDFNREDHKRHVWNKVRDASPYHLIGSPLFLYFCVLQ